MCTFKFALEIRTQKSYNHFSKKKGGSHRRLFGNTICSAAEPRPYPLPLRTRSGHQMKWQGMKLVTARHSRACSRGISASKALLIQQNPRDMQFLAAYLFLLIIFSQCNKTLKTGIGFESFDMFRLP